MSIENSHNTIINRQHAGYDNACRLLFDTRQPFEFWLRSLKSPSPDLIPASDNRFDSNSIHTEPASGAHCDLVFDGVLHVDGLLKGQIRSAYGTLVMSEQGRIEADVDVRIAMIDGYVEGNIRATEKVMLDRNTRVTGDIYSPSLAGRDGAIFEGKSFLLERSVYSEIGEYDSSLDCALPRAAGCVAVRL